MSNFDWTHIVTCQTEGCYAKGVSLPQILLPNSTFSYETESWIPLLDENGQEVYECTCGPCGNKIADIVPYSA